MSLLERDRVVGAPAARRHAAPVQTSTVLPSHRLGMLPLLAAHRSRVAVAVTVVVAVLAAGILVTRSRGPEPLVLSLDGTTSLVSSSAATVGGLLHAEGVTITAHDVVTPAPGTDLSGVHEVTVAYGRQVVVTVDGASRTMWTTSEDVAGLLGELDVSGSAYVSQSPLSPLPLTGATLTVRTAKTVTLVADGSSTPLTTTATTVGQA
ncbi:MAG: ubiquitin-like domain-containing protein, partial [Candidatus Nanopelagicales bacterium]